MLGQQAMDFHKQTLLGLKFSLSWDKESGQVPFTAWKMALGSELGPPPDAMLWELSQ